jgi:hypothetical protein
MVALFRFVAAFCCPVQVCTYCLVHRSLCGDSDILCPRRCAFCGFRRVQTVLPHGPFSTCAVSGRERFPLLSRALSVNQLLRSAPTNQCARFLANQPCLPASMGRLGFRGCPSHRSERANAPSRAAGFAAATTLGATMGVPPTAGLDALPVRPTRRCRGHGYPSGQPHLTSIFTYLYACMLTLHHEHFVR